MFFLSSSTHFYTTLLVHHSSTSSSTSLVQDSSSSIIVVCRTAANRDKNSSAVNHGFPAVKPVYSSGTVRTMMNKKKERLANLNRIKKVEYRQEFIVIYWSDCCRSEFRWCCMFEKCALRVWAVLSWGRCRVDDRMHAAGTTCINYEPVYTHICGAPAYTLQLTNCCVRIIGRYGIWHSVEHREGRRHIFIYRDIICTGSVVGSHGAYEMKGTS